MSKQEIDVAFNSAQWINGVVVLINTNIFETYLVAGESNTLFEAIGRDLDNQIREQYLSKLESKDDDES